jgi:hypothetical protein
MWNNLDEEDDMKVIPCVLIAAGAAASIATSKVDNGWGTSTQADITASAIDNQTTSVKYLVHAELQGPGPYVALDGTLTAFVYVKQRTVPTGVAAATIELRSLTHPDIAPVTIDVGLDSPDVHEVEIPAWLLCSGDPCAEDYELEIRRRDPIDTLPTTDISGWVLSVAKDPDAKSNITPSGTNLVVTVTAE